MKRIMIVVALLMMCGSTANAAMVCALDTAGTNGGKRKFGEMLDKTRVTVKCTFDTTPGTATDTFDQSIMGPMDGKYVLLVTVYPGSTAPDAASVAISDSNGLALMTAAGNGLNLVHATNTLDEYLEGPNGDSYHLVDANFPWTVTVTDQATNNAIIYIRFDTVD
jgi:hypothetical protein